MNVINAITDNDLYQSDYFDSYYVNDKKRDEMYEQERSRIMKFFPHGGIILDVGCGVGGFLSRFDDRWEKIGIEVSDYAREKAVRKGILLVRSLNVVDFDSIDVVVFRGTLQHINFPMESIYHAARVLKSGGMLVILATPDTDSLVYKIWGKLPALDAPRNWVLFGSRFLLNILHRLGFDDIKILHPYLETPYANPLSDFFNFFVSIFFGWRRFAFPGNMMEIYARKK